MSPRKVAIVGFGPRGVGALERLMAHQVNPGAEPVEVTIFEPHPTPGAGSGYDPEQAPYLLMNFPAARIDLGWKSDGAPSATEIPSFSEWASTGAGQAESWFPPRALVGQYIATVAEKLIKSAPFPVQFVANPVVTVEPAPSGWLVGTPFRSLEFDDVLLTVGHALSTSGTPHSSDLPVQGQVDIRGFGLTAIDLILDLTEGRGGQFLPEGVNAFQYVGAPEGPSALFPHSRHGRPMLVKPELSVSRVPAEYAAAMIEQSRESLIDLSSGSGVEQLASVLAHLAAGLLASKHETERVHTWIEAAIGGELGSSPEPAESIARSLRISNGESAPDIEWALGLAWRSVYPAIVERFSQGGLPQSDARSFRVLAGELERLAFGPPPVNAAKILALVEAGVLDLSELDQPAAPRSRTAFNAVSEPPGLRLQQQPLPGLVAQGAIRVPAGLRGIETTRSARCVGLNGEPTDGLAACGRLTEDWVIGNDTLDRRLHPEIDRWAAEVCGFDRIEPAVAVAT